MIKSKLFGTDGRRGGSLVKDGAFKLCRNPFYVGVGSAIALFSAFPVIANSISEDPKYAAIPIVAAGLGLIAKRTHDYVKADEILLEEKFGDEYLNYKKNTPRYIPNLANLFKKR